VTRDQLIFCIQWQQMTTRYTNLGRFRRILEVQRQRGSTGWSASSEPQRFTRFFYPQILSTFHVR
jgi:hypothetical protein